MARFPGFFNATQYFGKYLFIVGTLWAIVHRNLSTVTPLHRIFQSYQHVVSQSAFYMVHEWRWMNIGIIYAHLRKEKIKILKQVFFIMIQSILLLFRN